MRIILIEMRAGYWVAFNAATNGRLDNVEFDVLAEGLELMD